MDKNNRNLSGDNQLSPTYILKLDEEIIWEGKDLKTQLEKEITKHPGRELTVAWKKKEREFLIV
ncbi:MAG: hypothetical protein GF315_02060 [candidate division Zixibacteria bacterium]|nr:hypothetical protein [candidate division Zixibacteria bacterium]